MTNAKILVVDDEPAIVNILYKELKILSYTVHMAFSGEEALKIIMAHPIDVLITDLRMPGMGGLALIGQAIKIKHDLQSIVLTGHGDMKNAIEALNNGARGYLQKPPDLDELAIHIDHCLERIGMKRALEVAKAYTDSIFASMADGIIVVSPEGVVRTVNRPACDMLGYSEKELINLPMGNSIFNLETLIRGEGFASSTEATLTAKDGYQVPVLISGSVMRDTEGKINGIIFVVKNITDHKQAQAQLEESESRFRAIAQSILDGVIVADMGERMTYWNDGAGRIFGYSGDEAQGKSVLDLMPTRLHSAFKKEFSKMRLTGQSTMLGKVSKHIGVRKNGEEFPCEISLSTWMASDTRFFSAIFRDIGETGTA